MAGLWYVLNGTPKRRGKSDGTGSAANPRAGLVPGDYKPSTSTTGVLPGSTLTPYNQGGQDLYITTNGTVLENLDIYGRVMVQASGVVIRNCRLRGSANTINGASAMIDCNHAAVFNCLIEYCTLVPDTPRLNQNGVIGHEYTARRCYVSQTTDGFGIYNKAGVSNAANVVLEANMVENLAYFQPDYQNGVSGATWHTDGTHNDCVQIQGGSNIRLTGNYLNGTSFYGAGSIVPSGRWPVTDGFNHGQCILIQKNSTLGELVNVVAEKNWVRGARQQAALQIGTYTYQNNIHSTTTWDWQGNGGYYIRVYDRAQCIITGIGTNRFEETNAVMTEPRLSGIDYIA